VESSGPTGFRGLDPERPITIYRRHLPHWRQDGATYFVTYRLADSLAKNRLRELADLRETLMREHSANWPDAVWETYASDVTRQTEHWLDQGMGHCVRREKRFSTLVSDSMHHFNDVRYLLGASS
jgi:putative transposase